MLKLGIAALVGFGVGVFVAKMAYEAKVRGVIHTGLDKVGLSGGFVEDTIDAVAGVAG